MNPGCLRPRWMPVEAPLGPRVLPASVAELPGSVLGPSSSPANFLWITSRLVILIPAVCLVPQIHSLSQAPLWSPHPNIRLPPEVGSILLPVSLVGSFILWLLGGCLGQRRHGMGHLTLHVQSCRKSCWLHLQNRVRISPFPPPPRLLSRPLVPWKVAVLLPHHSCSFPDFFFNPKGLLFSV